MRSVGTGGMRGLGVHTGGVEELRALHDAYVWQVNAAVGEDRMDLVWQLADEFSDRALALMSAAEETGCGRADCAVCARMAAATAAAWAAEHEARARPRRRLLRWTDHLRGH
jgi:hypothetical protein